MAIEGRRCGDEARRVCNETLTQTLCILPVNSNTVGVSLALEEDRNNSKRAKAAQLFWNSLKVSSHLAMCPPDFNHADRAGVPCPFCGMPLQGTLQMGMTT
jgi:hypothetical protein